MTTTQDEFDRYPSYTQAMLRRAAELAERFARLDAQYKEYDSRIKNRTHIFKEVEELKRTFTAEQGGAPLSIGQQRSIDALQSRLERETEVIFEQSLREHERAAQNHPSRLQTGGDLLTNRVLEAQRQGSRQEEMAARVDPFDHELALRMAEAKSAEHIARLRAQTESDLRRDAYLDREEDARAKGRANPNFAPIPDRYGDYRRTTPAPIRSISPSDMQLKPYAPPTGVNPALPEKTRQQMELLYYLGQVKRDVQGGMDPVQALAKVPVYHQQVLEGKLPLKVLGAFSNVLAQARSQGWSQSTTETQLGAMLGATGGGMAADTNVPLPSYSEQLARYQGAEGRMDAKYRETARLLGTQRGYSQPQIQALEQQLRGKLKRLSDEQLSFVENPSSNRQGLGGPGTGKTEMLEWAFVHDVAHGKYRPQQAFFTAATNNAIDVVRSRFGADVAPLFPEWNFDQAKQGQFRTMHSKGMSLLNATAPSSTKSVMQVLGERSGIPDLHRWTLAGSDPAQNIQKADEDRESRVKAYFDKLSETQKRVVRPAAEWNYTKYGQYISESKSRMDTATRLSSGKTHFEAKNFSHPDAVLYAVDQQMRANKEIDYDDMIKLMVSAVKMGLVPLGKSGFFDEHQDLTEMQTLASMQMIEPGGTRYYTGDPGQSIQPNAGRADLFLPQRMRDFSTTELHNNFRSSAQIAAETATLYGTPAMQRSGVTPPTVAMGPRRLLGQVPTHVVGSSFGQVHQRLTRDWFEAVGVTPQMMRANMDQGMHPLTGATSLPVENPIIFPQKEERTDFLGTLKRELVAALGPERGAAALKAIVYPTGGSQNYQEGGNSPLMMRLPTVSQIKGAEANTVFLSRTRGGLWSDVGWRKQIATAASRAKLDVRYYSVDQGRFKHSNYDNSADFDPELGLLSHGAKADIAPFTRNLVVSQELDYSDIPSGYQAHDRVDFSTPQPDFSDLSPEQHQGLMQFGLGALAAQKDFQESTVGGTGMFRTPDEAGLETTKSEAGKLVLAMRNEEGEKVTHTGLSTQTGATGLAGHFSTPGRGSEDYEAALIGQMLRGEASSPGMVMPTTGSLAQSYSRMGEVIPPFMGRQLPLLTGINLPEDTRGLTQQLKPLIGHPSYEERQAIDEFAATDMPAEMDGSPWVGKHGQHASGRSLFGEDDLGFSQDFTQDPREKARQQMLGEFANGLDPSQFGTQVDPTTSTVYSGYVQNPDWMLSAQYTEEAKLYRQRRAAALEAAKTTQEGGTSGSQGTRHVLDLKWIKSLAGMAKDASKEKIQSFLGSLGLPVPYRTAPSPHEQSRNSAEEYQKTRDRSETERGYNRPADEIRFREHLRGALKSPLFYRLPGIQDYFSSWYTAPTVAERVQQQAEFLASGGSTNALRQVQGLVFNLPWSQYPGRRRKLQEPFQKQAQQQYDLVRRLFEERKFGDWWHRNLGEILGDHASEGKLTPELFHLLQESAGTLAKTAAHPEDQKRAQKFADLLQRNIHRFYSDEELEPMLGRAPSKEQLEGSYTHTQVRGRGIFQSVHTRSKALMNALFIKGYDEKGEPIIRKYGDAFVQKSLGMFPHFRGSLARNAKELGPELRLSMAQSRVSPFSTELAAHALRLEGGLAGNAGGVIGPDGSVSGLASVEQRLLEMSIGRQGLSVEGGITRPRKLPSESEEVYAANKATRQQAQAQLRQVSALRRTLGSQEWQEQAGHTLSAIMRTTTGAGAFKGQLDEENSKFDRFFGPLRKGLETGTRTVEGNAELVNALSEATRHMQETGGLRREHVNRVLTALGHDPNNSDLFGMLPRFAREWGNPESDLPLTRIAGEFGKAGNAQLHQDVVSQLTRVPLQQGRTYRFMGGAEGYPDIVQGNQGLETGMEGTLLPWDPQKPEEFGYSRDVVNFREANMMSHKWEGAEPHPDSTPSMPKWVGGKPGVNEINRSQRLPDERVYGVLARLQVGKHSFPVRADQLALPEQWGRALAPLIASGSFGMSSNPAYSWTNHAPPSTSMLRSQSRQPDIHGEFDISQIGGLFPGKDDEARKQFVAYAQRIRENYRDAVKRAVYHGRPVPSHEQGFQRARENAYSRFDHPTAEEQADERRRLGYIKLLEQHPQALFGDIDPASFPVKPPEKPPEPKPLEMIPPHSYLYQGYLKNVLRPAYKAHLESMGNQALSPEEFLKQAPVPSKDSYTRADEWAPTLEQAQQIHQSILSRGPSEFWPQEQVAPPPPPPPPQKQRVAHPLVPIPSSSLLSEEEHVPQEPPDIQDALLSLHSRITGGGGSGGGGEGGEPPPSLAQHMADITQVMLHGNRSPQTGAYEFSPLSDQQRAFVTSPAQGTLLNAGPGSGKTGTMVRKGGYLASQHGILPSQQMYVSYMRSGVDELTKRLFGDKRKGVRGIQDFFPKDDQYRFNDPRTVHSLGWRILMQGANWKKQKFPVLKEMGIPFSGKLLIDPNDADRYGLSQEDWAERVAGGQTPFLKDVMTQARGGKPPDDEDVKKMLSFVGKMKSGGTYDPQQDPEKGKEYLGLYEQARKAGGHLDPADLLTLSDQYIQQKGVKGLPRAMRGIRSLFFDEAQDNTKAGHSLLRSIYRALSGDHPTHLVAGQDLMQQQISASFGGLPPEAMEPLYNEMAGPQGIETHNLNVNRRSDAGPTFLTRAFNKWLRGEGGKTSEDQVVPPGTPIGTFPRFGMARTQDALYQQIFGQMQKDTGLTSSAMVKNFRSGLMPLSGSKIDPSKMAGVFSRWQDVDLMQFEVARSLMADHHLDSGEASDIVQSMFITHPPRESKIAEMSDEEQAALRSRIQLGTPGRVRSHEYQNVYQDVTRVGGGGLLGWLKNMGIGGSRLVHGGQNYFYGATHPFPNKEAYQTYLSNPNALVDPARGQLMSSAQVQLPGYGEKGMLFPSKTNIPEKFGGGLVPAGFGTPLVEHLDMLAQAGYSPDNPQNAAYLQAATQAATRSHPPSRDWSAFQGSVKNLKKSEIAELSAYQREAGLVSFGKHRGSQFKDIPDDYLRWITDPEVHPKGFAFQGMDWGSIAKDILAARAQGHPEQANQIAQQVAMQQAYVTNAPDTTVHLPKGPGSSPPLGVSSSSSSGGGGSVAQQAGAVNAPLQVGQLTANVTGSGGVVINATPGSVTARQPTAGVGGTPPPPLPPIGTPPTATSGMGGGGGGNTWLAAIAQNQGNPPPAPSGGGGGGYGGYSRIFQVGRSVSAIGSELSSVGQTLKEHADQKILQGSEYRHATMQLTMQGTSPVSPTRLTAQQQQAVSRLGQSFPVVDPTHSVAGAYGDQGDFNFSDPSSLISQLSHNLPMYSYTQIAQGLQDYLSSTNQQYSTSAVGSSNDVLALAAVSGLSPGQLTPQLSNITGLMNAQYGNPGSGFIKDQTSQLMGMLTGAFHGNLTPYNVMPYLQSMNQVLPTLIGNTPNSLTGSVTQAGTMFQLALNSGQSAENLPQVAEATGTLSNLGSHPNLQGQYFLSNLYGEKALTASPDYWQFQQEQLSLGQQVKTLGVQQNILGGSGILSSSQNALSGIGVSLNSLAPGGKLSLPQLQINADNAQITLDKVNFQAAQFGLAQGQASFNFEQYYQTQQLGPIGATAAQTGRSAYFDFQRRQLAAGYNPLNADQASTFKPTGPVFGLQNEQFYAGVEHQRSMLVLGRSPLLADAAFQEQMKYLNKQENFYVRSLDLQNQQRAFQKDWGQRSLNMQAAQLKAQQAVVADNILFKQYDKQIHEIESQNLPRMVAIMQQLLNNRGQWIGGQGPINGGNVTPTDIVSHLATAYSSDTFAHKTGNKDNDLYTALRSAGLSPQEISTILPIIKQAAKSGVSSVEKQIAGASDNPLLQQTLQMINGGAFLYQTQQAYSADQATLGGGTDATWQQMIQAVNNEGQATELLNKTLSPGSPFFKVLGDFANFGGQFVKLLGSFINLVGLVGGGGGAGGMGTGGAGGHVGPPPGGAGVGGGEFDPLPISDKAAGFWVKLLEDIQMKKQGQEFHFGPETFDHYGIQSPHVNADFHQKMNYGIHQGVDFAAPQGSPLSEFIGGEVTGTGFYPWGGEVDVRIPGGMTERYIHLSSINVHGGQKIRRGDRIGLTGGGTPQSGLGKWSSGAHSHVQYDYGNINQGVDPWVVWLALGDRNLSSFYGTDLLAGGTPSLYGGKSGGRGGTTGLFHMYEGGIAMRPITSTLADGGEPEAVIPLSKLQQVASTMNGSSGSTTGSSPLSASSSSQGTPSVSVSLSGVNFHVHTQSATMSDQEKDQLMADAITILGVAVQQVVGKR